MKAQKDLLKDRFTRIREINLSVTGRKSGRRISIPVWFVSEDQALYLLPVQGSDTQWYKNALEDPSIEVEASGAKAHLKLVPITEAKRVASVVDKFRDKYGSGDVKKYYAKLDVAALADIS